MKFKEIPFLEKPREKLLKYGKENLTDSELLAIILKTGTKGEDVLSLAFNCLKSIEKIENLKDINYETLTKIKGIGKAKALELLAVVELSKRIYYETTDKKKNRMINSNVIYENCKHLFEGLKQEHFYCLYLNSKKEIIEKKLLFIGTVNKSVVHPREVFKEAYKLSASSIICLHNHPSGDVTPSVEDINLTSSLIEIGRINKIPIIDHLIIGGNSYYSFYNQSKKVGIL